MTAITKYREMFHVIARTPVCGVRVVSTEDAHIEEDPPRTLTPRVNVKYIQNHPHLNERKHHQRSHEC